MTETPTTGRLPDQGNREPRRWSPADHLVQTSALDGALTATIDALRSGRARSKKPDMLLRPDLEAAALRMTTAVECLKRLGADGLVREELSASVLAAPAEARADFEHLFGNAAARHMPAYLRIAEELGMKPGDEAWDEADLGIDAPWAINWADVMASHPGWAAATEADREAVLTMHALERVGLSLSVLDGAIHRAGRDNADASIPF